MRPSKYRGPNTFYFKRLRFPLDPLRARMAELRTCLPGGGGHWNSRTGDGEAFHKNGDQFGGWYMVRAIKGGQWAGPWRRVRD